MKTPKNFLSLLLAVPFVTSVAHANIGERANYFLDKSSNRTHSMIRSGVVKTKVTGFDRSNNVYKIKADYKLNVMFRGTQRGTRTLDVPPEYMNRELLERLRREKKIVMPKYKLRHLGYKSVRNKDGNRYENCDVIEFHDIDTSGMEMKGLRPFVQILIDAAKAQFNLEKKEQIKNLRIKAHVHRSIPVLGAAKVDMSGIAQGFSFKAGFDYKR